MSEYLFVFGRTPGLALVELQTAFPSAVLLSDHTALISKKAFDEQAKTSQEVIAQLGGTIKIAQVLTRESKLDAAFVAKLILDEPTTGQIVFGISRVEGQQPVAGTFLAGVKEVLQSHARPARFVSSAHGPMLSSVVVSKQHVTEIIVVETKGGAVLARTLAVQNADEWGLRDYGRPFADPKAGMLPPKVARMAVNIAHSGERRTTNREPRTLIDPFCGMGTILAEALLAGWKVIGSDQSEEVVGKARKNLEWLTGSRLVRDQDAFGQGETLSRWKLFVSDATHVSEYLPKESVDAIVTEPFMGSTNIKNQISNIKNTNQTVNVKNIIRGLEKLYIGCLKDWRVVLKPSGRVVMALPEYRIGDKTFFVKNVVDRCENLGYTKLLGPIEYSRPQAVVKREFFVFQKR